jgi:hypothetical protein
VRRAAPRRAATLAPLAFAYAMTCAAVPPTPQELAAWCGNAEDSAHCGRLVEEQQLKRLPGLATRDGLNLKITLFPSGTTTFTDVEDLRGGKSHSLWDTLDPINAVVIYTTEGDVAKFTLLQRATGRRTVLPSDPVLAPDRQRLATADFCAENCDNEVAVWRVTRDSVVKDLVLKPAEKWSDVTAKWKDAGTLVLEYKLDGAAKTLERALTADDWKRAAAAR